MVDWRKGGKIGYIGGWERLNVFLRGFFGRLTYERFEVFERSPTHQVCGGICDETKDRNVSMLDAG